MDSYENITVTNATIIPEWNSKYFQACKVEIPKALKIVVDYNTNVNDRPDMVNNETYLKNIRTNVIDIDGLCINEVSIMDNSKTIFDNISNIKKDIKKITNFRNSGNAIKAINNFISDVESHVNSTIADAVSPVDD